MYSVVWSIPRSRPFLGHHYLVYIFSLSDLCLGVEKKILKKLCIFTVWLICPPFSTRTPAPGVHNAFSLYDLYGHAPSTRTPALGFMKFTSLVDPPWSSLIIHLVLSEPKKEIHHIPYGCYIPNLVNISSVVLEKVLTHDVQYDGRQPTHSNNSPESLRWPKQYKGKICMSRFHPNHKQNNA